VGLVFKKKEEVGAGAHRCRRLPVGACCHPALSPSPLSPCRRLPVAIVVDAVVSPRCRWRRLKGRWWWWWWCGGVVVVAGRSVVVVVVVAV